MAKVQSIKFGEFMDGSWKSPQLNEKDVKRLKKALIRIGVTVPMTLTAKHVMAAVAAPVAASTGSMVADTSLHILAHALDPIVQILVAISLPVASVVMIGGCFFFMFGNSDKAWSTIQNAGLGYILIQLSPLFIRVLEQVGKSIG